MKGKKTISGTIKNIEINQSISFPFSYKGTVLRSTIQAIKTDTNKTFSCIRSAERKSYIITRLS